jgi:hypothetical protein
MARVHVGLRLEQSCPQTELCEYVHLLIACNCIVYNNYRTMRLTRKTNQSRRDNTYV